MSVERVHLIGVGGDGMSALARLYLEAGYRVSGSDLNERPALGQLRQLGARIVTGHDPAAVAGATRVVASPAVPENDPERQAARSVGIVVEPRARALAALLGGREVVCVAGSHGKSTTSTAPATPARPSTGGAR